MKPRTALLAALLLPCGALAQTPDFNILVDGTAAPIWVLEGQAGTYTEMLGIGNPSVVWDQANTQYLMFFETRLSDAYLFNDPLAEPPGLGLLPSDFDDCRKDRDPARAAIVWAIGRATSPDGFAWTLDGDHPLFVPTPGTYFSCQAAQPAVIFEASTGDWHMWFKAMQWNANTAGSPEPCDDAARNWPWGCERVTGLGYASSADGASWTPALAPAVPMEDILSATGGSSDAVGFPRSVALGSAWHLWFTTAPNIYHATGLFPDTGWTIESTPAIVPGAQTWMEDKVYNGTAVCQDVQPRLS
ncbi:MAG: hypothetical protein JRJ84_19790, partial [Deltaproteobacteria bacterium]|nr:hypothetical protein [Deltaproteobacteria bacterium]